MNVIIAILCSMHSCTLLINKCLQCKINIDRLEELLHTELKKALKEGEYFPDAVAEIFQQYPSGLVRLEKLLEVCTDIDDLLYHVKENEKDEERAIERYNDQVLPTRKRVQELIKIIRHWNGECD